MKKHIIWMVISLLALPATAIGVIVSMQKNNVICLLICLALLLASFVLSMVFIYKINFIKINNKYKNIPYGVDMVEVFNDYQSMNKENSSNYSYEMWKDKMLDTYYGQFRGKNRTNFKRYLSRTLRHQKNMIGAYIGVVIPIIAALTTALLTVYTDQEICLMGKLLLVIGVYLGTIIFLIIEYKGMSDYTIFVEDLLEIMDQCEKEENSGATRS